MNTRVAEEPGDDTAGSPAPARSPLSGSIHVIINPIAGGGRGKRMWSAIRAMLPPRGIDVRESVVRLPGEARDAAEGAAQAGANVVVAIGGDGTLNEALNGLMTVAPHRRPAVAFVPGGTANILARALGLPRTAPELGQLLLSGVRRRIDVGLVNDRYYATIAGAGFDAEVVARAVRWRRWGPSKAVHVAGGLAALATYRPIPARVTVDGSPRVVPLTFLAAANTAWYGGGLHIAPGAQADDGRLLVVYGVGLTRLGTLAVTLRTLIGRHLDHPGVTHAAAMVAEVEADRPLAVHADGEWLGRWRAVRFEVIPGSLELIVPAVSASAGDRKERA